MSKVLKVTKTSGDPGHGKAHHAPDSGKAGTGHVFPVKEVLHTANEASTKHSSIPMTSSKTNRG